MSTRMDRQGLGILSLEECLALIDASPVGRLAFVTDGSPLVLPINHVRLGTRIGFRSADGAKLDAATAGGEVAFEVDGWDADASTGWSVVVVGRATLATDIEVEHYRSTNLTPWAQQVPRDHWITIHSSRVSGRWTGERPQGSTS